MTFRQIRFFDFLDILEVFISKIMLSLKCKYFKLKIRKHLGPWWARQADVRPQPARARETRDRTRPRPSFVSTVWTAAEPRSPRSRGPSLGPTRIHLSTRALTMLT